MFGKIDYVMFPASALGEMWQKLGKDFGDEYLFDLGYIAGKDGSKEMLDKLGMLNKSVPINKSIIDKMFETLGFGNMKFEILHSKQGKCLLKLTNHPVIEYGKRLFGNKSKICSLYRGIFSIHGERELRIKNCHFIETQCICNGDKQCEWSTGIFKKE